MSFGFKECSYKEIMSGYTHIFWFCPFHKSCPNLQVCLDTGPLSFDCDFIINILNGLNGLNHKFSEFVVRKLIFYW